MRSSDLDQVLRWLGAGGTCEVAFVSPQRITISLITCDGGDIMARITSSEPDLIAFGRDRLIN